MQEASRRKLKAASVLVIYSVPESLLVACCIQDGSTNLEVPYANSVNRAPLQHGADPGRVVPISSCFREISGRKGG